MKQSVERTNKTLNLKIYHEAVKAVHAKIHQWEVQNHDKFSESLHQIEEKMHEWGTATQEEAGKLMNYLKRDLEDASKAIASSTAPDAEWRQWLKFDLEQIEQQTLEKIFEIADSTQLEWLQFQDELQSHGEFHTGEIKSIGSLQCTQCGQSIHFNAPGHIPPCPACHATVFRRLADDQTA